MKVYSDEEYGIRYRHAREEGMYDWCHTCQCAWPCDTGVILAKHDALLAQVERLRAALLRIWHLYPKASEAATIANEALER